MRTQCEIPIITNIRIGQPAVDGKARAQQARGKRPDARDLNALAVESRGPSASRGEEFLVVRIEHHPHQNCLALRQSDGNAKTRISVSEIGGPVERIYVPAKIRVTLAPGALLCGDS